MYKKIILALIFISSIFGYNSFANPIKFNNENPVFRQKKQKKLMQ